MLSKFELQNLSHASRILEQEGLFGYDKVVETFGENVAKAMVVVYLRSLNGSLRHEMANVRVPRAVKQQLRDRGMFEDEVAEQQQEIRLSNVKEQAEKYMEQQVNVEYVEEVAAEIDKKRVERRNLIREKLKQKRMSKRASTALKDKKQRDDSKGSQVEEIQKLLEEVENIKRESP